MSGNEEQPAEWGLVLPAGHNAEDAYAAGWEMGQLMARLEIAAARFHCADVTATIRTANLEYVDLVAECAHYRVAEREDCGEWTTVVLRSDEKTYLDQTWGKAGD